MSRTLFTTEQLITLRNNPYIYSVSSSRIVLTKEFKEIFMNAYLAGESPRKILEDHGFDISIIGERRIYGISQHIRAEYEKHGEFHEGYRKTGPKSSSNDKPLSKEDELKQLKHEVDYLRQEVEFLKKISSIKNTRK